MSRDRALALVAEKLEQAAERAGQDEEPLVQINVHLPERYGKLRQDLSEELDCSNRDVVMLALDALAALVDDLARSSSSPRAQRLAGIVKLYERPK